MTHDERKQFGKRVQEGRKKKGWSMLQLLVAAAAIDPTLRTSIPTLNRLENGGLLPSEEVRGVTCKDTSHNVRLRAAVAAALDIPLSVAASAPVEPVVVAAPAAASSPVEQAPKRDGRKGNTFKAAQVALAAKRAAQKAGAEESTENPKYAKFYTSLTTRNGFSMGAIRSTLRQLNALGIPTDEVRANIKQRFSEFVDSLDT